MAATHRPLSFQQCETPTPHPLWLDGCTLIPLTRHLPSHATPPQPSSLLRSSSIVPPRHLPALVADRAGHRPRRGWRCRPQAAYAAHHTAHHGTSAHLPHRRCSPPLRLCAQCLRRIVALPARPVPSASGSLDSEPFAPPASPHRSLPSPPSSTGAASEPTALSSPRPSLSSTSSAGLSKSSAHRRRRRGRRGSLWKSMQTRGWQSVPSAAARR